MSSVYETPPLFMVFDVESVGLHGEGFAVAGGLYTKHGVALWEFRMRCPVDACEGDDAGREWVEANVPAQQITHSKPSAIRSGFWAYWLQAKSAGAVMAAECAWPVEANFLAACVKDDPSRQWEGPYPLHDVASWMAAAGMDPMTKYERLPSELQVHDPLADARQSARLLATAAARLKKQPTMDAFDAEGM